MYIRNTKTAISQPSYLKLQFNIPWSQFPSLYGSCHAQTVGREGSLQETESTSPCTFMHASAEPQNNSFQSHLKLHAVLRVWQTRPRRIWEDDKQLPSRRQQHWSCLPPMMDPVPLPHLVGLKNDGAHDPWKKQRITTKQIKQKLSWAYLSDCCCRWDRLCCCAALCRLSQTHCYGSVDLLVLVSLHTYIYKLLQPISKSFIGLCNEEDLLITDSEISLSRFSPIRLSYSDTTYNSKLKQRTFNNSMILSFFFTSFIVAGLMVHPAIHTAIGQFGLTYLSTFMFLDSKNKPKGNLHKHSDYETSHNHLNSGSNPRPWSCEAPMLPNDSNRERFLKVFSNQGHILTRPPVQSHKSVSH